MRLCKETLLRMNLAHFRRLRTAWAEERGSLNLEHARQVSVFKVLIWLDDNAALIDRATKAGINYRGLLGDTREESALVARQRVRREIRQTHLEFWRAVAQIVVPVLALIVAILALLK
jgi:hypothetical protein